MCWGTQGMRTEKLLRSIWREDVRVGDNATSRAFARGFQDIIQVRTLPLRIAGTEAPVVMAEDTELMPGLPLGDVLAEELELDVPYGTLVVMLPETGPCKDMPHGLSRAFGQAVADTLLLAVVQSGLPVDRQTEALYYCAHAAARMTACAALHRRGIDRRAFGLGLGIGLSGFWRNGALSLPEPAEIFTRPDFLWTSELVAYLRRLDPAFSAPDPAAIPGDLLRVSDGPTGLALWIARVESNLRHVLGAPAQELEKTPSITSRFNLQ